MSFNKQKLIISLDIKLEILQLNYKLLGPDERFIALIFLKRKVRALQGCSAR